MNILLSLFKKKNNHSDSTENSEMSKGEPEGDFVKKHRVKGINIKTSLMEYAALKRKLNVKRLGKRLILVELSSGINLAFHNMNGVDSSKVGKNFCDNKYIARELLRKNKLTVVDSEIFDSESYNDAVKYVQKLGFPVVVKPISLSRGRGITTNIQNLNEFSSAWEYGLSAYRRKRKTNSLLIERHVNGDDYRFFVVDGKVISVTHRKRANVVGDGISTVYELIKKKNVERSKNPYLSSYLIPYNIKDLDILEKKGLDLQSVPATGEEIILRSQSNISAGGDSVDVTDIVHPDFNKIAIKSVEAIPGIEYAGVDIITPDITAKPTSTNHIVGEVEFSPAPIAHFPYKGKVRDMAGAILEYYIQRYSS